jgi:MFS transporter, DHA2 family, methylenomycin A resistance protein
MRATTRSSVTGGPVPGALRRPSRSPWPTLVIMSAGLFLAVLSTTVVSVALPAMGAQRHASATGLEWIVDAYVLTYATLLVAGGVAGDRCGRAGTFLAGVALFGLGSLAAGLAPTAGLLIAARVAQGVGPALLIPGSLAIVRAVFTDPRQRAVAIGLWSTSSGVAMAVGPALGGVIVDGLGWRWVFLLNVPLAAAVLLAGARWGPRLARGGHGPFDWTGAVTSMAGLGLLAFGVIDGQAQGWAAAPVIAAFVTGAVALAAFVVAELRLARPGDAHREGQPDRRRPPEPFVTVDLFWRPAFACANLAALTVFFAFVGAIVYFSAFFQQAQGHSPVAAGLAVGVLGVAYAVAAAWSGRLVARFGERWPLLAGLVISGLATLALRRLGPVTGLAAIWWNFALLGAGIGLCGTPMTTLALSAVDVARAGMASAVLNASRQLGQVFGVAVLGALVYGYLPGSAAAGPLTAAQRQLFTAGLHNALLVAGVALLGTAAVIGGGAAAPLRRRSARAAHRPGWSPAGSPRGSRRG